MDAKNTLPPEFQEEIRQAMSVPDADAAFLADLRREVVRPWPRPVNQRPFFTRPAWITALVVVFLLAAGLIAAGPQRVLAAFRQLFGYIPGVGIVDTNAPIRVLAEPVSVTRDGVTVSVNKAFLSADKTTLDYGVAGVPLSAYPKGEAVTGCTDLEYLRLPDGSHLELNAPVPANVSEATFVMPCIFNTLPGTVPTDWELPLHFVTAPPDLTVMPVIELTPVAVATGVQATPAAPSQGASATLAPQGAAVVIDKEIETNDGYILIGMLRSQVPSNSSIRQTGVLVIQDASGKSVPYTFPQDINEIPSTDIRKGEMPFSVQFQATGLAFPLTIQVPGVVVSPLETPATAELDFDAGTDPQPGQEWKLNQDIQIAGHTLKLVSINTDSRNGYGFMFETDKDVAGLSVQIEGYTPVGGGGGYGEPGRLSVSVSYPEIPKGKLKLVFSNLMLASQTQYWQAQWSPQTVRTDWPTPTSAPYPVCLTADNIGQLQPLPNGLDGWALSTEMNPDIQLVLNGFHGGQPRLILPQVVRGTLSMDGQWLAYSDPSGLEIVNLASGEKSLLPGIQSRDLHWSPDGSQIAYVTGGDENGIFVFSRQDESNKHQLSNLGYESIAGWSPDGKLLYYAIPGASQDGFSLRVVDVATGETRDLFTLKDSSLKLPMPALSPDGTWIAYRGRDGVSLYLIKIDGTQGHLIAQLPSPSYPISGLAWAPGGKLLGISTYTPDSQDGQILLMQPDSCETYLLPGLHGDLDGLLIP
jgi:hypothetical protein